MSIGGPDLPGPLGTGPVFTAGPELRGGLAPQSTCLAPQLQAFSIEDSGFCVTVSASKVGYRFTG